MTDSRAPALLELDTDRLRIRRLTQQHERLYCDLYGDAPTMQFIGRPWSPQRAARNFRRTLDAMRRRPLEQWVLAVVDLATGQGLGICSLQRIDERRRQAEVGVMLRPDWHSRGVAKECTHALVTRAFQTLPLDTIQARIAPDHVVAERVLVGVGFRRGDEVAPGSGTPQQTVLFAHRQSWPHGQHPQPQRNP